MSRQKKPPQTIRIARYVDIENEDHKQELRDFSDNMGRAISRVGSTYSVGSMALTVLGGSEIRKSLNRLSNQDRGKVEIRDLAGKLNDALKQERPREIDLEVAGLGMFGQAVRGGYGNRAKLGFILIDDGEVAKDIHCVRTVLSDNKIPEARIPRDRIDHVTFGDIYLDKLLAGEGENPNLLIPKRLTMPDILHMCGVSAEPLGLEQA